MKRKRATPEVLTLFREGRLSPIDLDWISRLRPESQLAAARKCLKPNPTFAVEYRDRSTIMHPKVCGGRRV